MSRRVLVTGGAGYIGSHVCKALAQSGIVPVTFDNLSLGHRSAVKWGPLIVGDLAHKHELRAAMEAFPVEAVIHLAGLASVAESVAAPDLYVRNNVTGTRNLLEVMAEIGIPHLVFSSSCAVYGVPEQLPVKEDCPLAPVSPYGESKEQAEMLLRWSESAHGLRWASLRYFNAAGADPDGELGECHEPETHLIPLAIRAALDRSHPLKIFGTDYPTRDGTPVRDFVHVTDLAQGHVQALEYLQCGGTPEVFNLGSGKGVSVREVVAATEALTGYSVVCREFGRRPGDPPQLAADFTRAREVLGWQPRYSDLGTIIGTAFAWERNQRLAVAAE